MPKPTNVRFDLRTLQLSDQSLVIEDLDSLPDKVGVRGWVDKAQLLTGEFEKSVFYDLWKVDKDGIDGDKLQVYSPTAINMPDNVLAAMLYANQCLRRVLEDELKKRKQFRHSARAEIDSFTGSDGSG